jgi:hypothetical protein
MELVSGGITDVQSIMVATESNDISLWVTSRPDNLWYIYGERTTASSNVAWNMPILLATDALSVAAMRSTNRNANEIFVLTLDQSITHFWQDPGSTLWRKYKALVKQDAYVLNYESYTPHLHFESGSFPLAAKVKVTTSEWQYCAINGLTDALDTAIPAEIPLDF